MRVPVRSFCVAPLSKLSVCKKIGLGYVPAVAFMLVVALASLLALQSAGVRGHAVLALVLAGTAVAGAASVAAMLTAFSVGVRVRAVLAAAEAAAEGDLDQRVPVRPAGDEVDRLAASFNTMTAELRQRIDVEHVAREAAEAASEAKSHFLSTMSHELRTPLTSLLGFNELLQESAAQKLSAAEADYVTRMHEAAQHLLSIVNDALDVERVEAGATAIEPKRIALGELIDPVVESVRPLADERRHSFSAVAPARPVTVFVDPIRVRQVLYNLLSNAIKFTPAGGSVTLRVAVAGNDLLFDVEDTGIGIPRDMHDRVFGLFERLHAGRIEAPGTGLGLALSRRLVELHNGEIEFDSAPGAGTTFRVTLPGTVEAGANGLVRERAARVRRTVMPAQPDERGLRVLLVDDEPLNTRLFADVLEADGHRVSVEHDGRAGAARVMSEPFDVLLLDIRMPEMRGDDLCRLLRTRGFEVPVIALSANALPTEVNEGLSAGFDAYLTKPISAVALRRAVREVVDRHRRSVSRAGVLAAMSSAS